MSYIYKSFLKSNRMNPKSFVTAWEAGRPITFSSREIAALALRIAEMDLSDGRFAEIITAGRAMRASKTATLSTKVIGGIKLNLFSDEDNHDSDVTAYIDPFTVLAAAISAFALGLALGALTENAMDDPDDGTSITITNNGNGTISGEQNPE